MTNTFIKDPDAIKDYQIDWSEWLGDDSISTSTWSVPTGITKVSDDKTADATIILLSGGSLGSTYELTNHIVTANALADDRSIFIKIRDQ